MASSGSQTFSYNPSGSRYKTVDGTDTTIYVNSYLEVRPEGATYYIFNGSQRIASVKDSTTTYYSQDHLGGTALATNSTGTVVEVDDYYPYGDSLTSIDAGTTAPVHHTFTDKEFDDSLGLFYFEARWYNPTIGRFVSEDPAQFDSRVSKFIQDPQSLNFYTYTRDNPVNLTDPTGECYWDLCFVETLAAEAIMTVAAVALSAAATFVVHEVEDQIINTLFPDSSSAGTTTTFPDTSSNGTKTITTEPRDAGGTVTTTPLTNETGLGQVDSQNLPIHGQPNTSGIIWEDGKIKQGRTYDENGNPVKDIDFSDHNLPDTHSDPHEHDWTPHEDGSYDDKSRSAPINDYSNN